MKTTLKGSLAALAAASLLLGGAGSLAFWTGSQDVTGIAITSGELKLGTPSCGTGWTIDGGAALTTQKIVPGDVLTKTCTIDLVATGAHLGANLTIGTPAWATTNALTAELAPTAVFKVNGATQTHITSADDTGTGEIVATVQVTFTGAAATNASQNLGATLNAVTVSAVQTHDAP